MFKLIYEIKTMLDCLITWFGTLIYVFYHLVLGAVSLPAAIFSKRPLTEIQNLPSTSKGIYNDNIDLLQDA